VATAVRPSGHQHRLWYVVMAMGLHCLEEYGLDLNRWLHLAFHIESNWLDFNQINFGYTAYMVGAAAIGWRAPVLALASPALVVANALLFHGGSSLVSGHYSPGTLSALLLFLPAAVACYAGAYRDGILDRKTLLGSIGLGLLLQLYPLAILGARGLVAA
jgi:hypothetical protein